MPALPLLGGFYSARSIIANVERCGNLYPEKNPQDSLQPYTLYLTPGLTKLSVAPDNAAWRGLYLASNGQLYGVCGRSVYSIAITGALTLLGQLQTQLTTPVSMADNNQVIIIVDGTTAGYCILMAGNTFGTIADPNFLGASHVDYIDTFFVFNQPGTQVFYSSLSNVTFAQLTSLGAFDPTYIASKTGQPDPISALICMHREIWILGTLRSTEVWYNAGNAAFPFAIASGVFIEEGCVAQYSLVKHDLSVFWLSVNKDGQAMVFMGANYTATRISTPAIAAQFSKYGTISDAIGMIYQQQDHVFYVLTFPNANKTWVYDISEQQWHERYYTDGNGNENRWLPNCLAAAYGIIFAGDYYNGNLYQLDLNNYTDNAMPIVRRRGFSHLVNDGKLLSYPGFRLDMEVGDWAPGLTLNVFLRWSDDRGRTFGNPVAQVGQAGSYLFQPKWNRLGIARDRVYEVFWSDAVQTAVQGAWLDPPPIPAGS